MQQALHTAEARNSTSPTSDNYTAWQSKAREIDLILIERIQKKKLYQNQLVFELADRNSPGISLDLIFNPVLFFVL